MVSVQVHEKRLKVGYAWLIFYYDFNINDHLTNCLTYWILFLVFFVSGP